MPLGPYILCALTESRSIPSRVHIDGDLAEGLRGVAVEEHAALAANGADCRESAE